MDREDEGVRFDCDGSVSGLSERSFRGNSFDCCATRMSVGLGMTREEWQELRSQVDDSFWVMRVIGTLNVFLSTNYHLK